MADEVANIAHLSARDTTFAQVSRAPQAVIERLPWLHRQGDDRANLPRRSRGQLGDRGDEATGVQLCLASHPLCRQR